MTTETEALLSIDGLRVTVVDHGQEREAVRGVSLQVSRGEILGIVGESGSGKSLTVSAIAALLPSGARLSGGEVHFKGEDLRSVSRRRLSQLRGREIAMVFQDSLTSLNPVMRVGDQVKEPLLLHHLASSSEARKAAEEGLRSMGLPDAHGAVKRYPHEFSGGMRQRAMIATALIARPDLIIADEPTTALDVTVQAQILEICRNLVRDSNVGLILISHDLGVISELASTVAVMYSGQIVESGPARELLARPQHPYTMALLESMPSSARISGADLKAIPGEPPALDSRPSGCSFHPRCRFAEARCAVDEPSLQAVGASLSACWVAQRAPLPQPAPSTPTPLAQRASSSARGAVEESANSEPLLRVAGLVKHYPVMSGNPFAKKAVVHALDDVSLEVRAGETLGIVGESGCGKSTLARCVLRLTEVDAGSVFFRGRDVTKLRGAELRRLRRYMQPVFQDPYSSLNPATRIGETVAEPVLVHGATRAEANRRVDEVLELVGLGSRYRDRFPHQLSGGQRQRVGIARALALETQLVVADEPISALDVSIQAQILNLLKDLQRRLGLTLLFISHDLRLVRHMSTNIAILSLGKVVEYGPAEDVALRPRHPYTQALLSAVPVVGGDSAETRIVLSGDPPSPMDPPSGCRFRTRCPRAQQICSEVEPLLGPDASTRAWACHFPVEQI
jgi:oligopeptide/dipeptide ABC transporter ATP-binding protein